MLSHLDDSLWHQLPTTFDHVGTSDPRFFDRIWFACYDPAGHAAAQVTMGVYSNMNVLDGGVMVLHGDRQHNLRVSRSLRPRFETAVGPLRLETEVPMERHRLIVESGDHGIALDLVWSARLPPEEEHPHFVRTHGRVVEDYQRFDQIGRVDGVIATPSGEIRAEGWWGGRDHSWGVRQGVGIAEPVNGTVAPRTDGSFVFAFLFFATSKWAGHVQIAERDGVRTYLTGLLRAWDDPGRDRHVIDATLTPTLHSGTRRFTTAVFDLDLDGGETLQLTAVSRPSTFAMAGLGYSGGWNDRLGLGVWRGDEHAEHETWDVSHAADVMWPDGTVDRPAHRIAPVSVSSAADDPGTGSLTLIC